MFAAKTEVAVVAGDVCACDYALADCESGYFFADCRYCPRDLVAWIALVEVLMRTDVELHCHLPRVDDETDLG